MSDIWSLGIVLMECATGRYPFFEQANCIEVAQTILDSDIPELPRSFSPAFRELVRQCLHKDPGCRLPAEALLGSPWLADNGARSIESSVQIVYRWIMEQN